MSAEKHVVVVSREWTKPAILIDVVLRGISISMPLAAFVDALAMEAADAHAALLAALLEPVTAGALVEQLVAAIGNPARLLTKAQLRTALTEAVGALSLPVAETATQLAPLLHAAADVVVDKMKRETSRVL